jgi:DNA-binding CsgD family transcriptional regulator
VDTSTEKFTFGSLITAAFIRRLFALSLILVGGWVLTSRVFPLFDTVLPSARDICTAVAGITLTLIACAATFNPRLLKEPVFFFSSITAIILGVATLCAGVALHSIPLLIVGASLGRMGTSWVQLVVGVSLIKMDTRALGICITGAFLLSYLLQTVLFLLPSWVGLAGYVMLPPLAYLLVRYDVRPLLTTLHDAEPPSQSAVTRPTSFLPFSHRLFICLFLFRLIYGYTLCFGEVNGTPLMTIFSIVPIAILAIITLGFRRRINPDVLYQASALLIIAGLLLVPIASSVGIHAAISNILAAGVVCFDVVFWFVLVAAAARNPSGSVLVFAWGNGVTAFGIIAGAFVGRATNQLLVTDVVITSLVTSVLLFVFIVYVFVVLKRFSFSDTITTITPSTPPVTPITSTQLLEQSCGCLAQRYGLTPRETEVLVLLARGRNGRFIQNALTVSHNTVKAHVKHIYQKMKVHTHQELVNLLEEVE